MSSQTVAQCSANVRALGNTARTLRRVILDNEPKVGRVDDYAQTRFREQWAKNRGDYNQLIDASEASAIKLAATIKYYLSLQGDVNDPDATDDLIEELGALNIKLQGLNFDQSSDFEALKSSFQEIGSALAAAVQERDAVVQAEIEAAQTEVATLDKQVQEISAKIRQEHEQEAEEATAGAVSTIGGLFNGGGKDKKAKPVETTAEDDKAAKDKKAAELAKAKTGATAALGKLLSGGKDQNKAQLYAAQEKLSIAQARLIKANSTARDREAADIDALLKTNQDIQKSLGTQVEQLQTFPNLTRQLATEVTNYLTAFENIKRDPSPDNQRTLGNLNRKVALAAGPWKEVASLLAEGYAKTQK